MIRHGVIIHTLMTNIHEQTHTHTQFESVTVQTALPTKHIHIHDKCSLAIYIDVIYQNSTAYYSAFWRLNS